MLLTRFSSFAFSFIDYEIGRIFVSVIIFYIEVKGKLVDFLSIKVVRISIVSKLHINIMYREEFYTKKKKANTKFSICILLKKKMGSSGNLSVTTAWEVVSQVLFVVISLKKAAFGIALHGGMFIA